jgi:hypothetical protein
VVKSGTDIKEQIRGSLDAVGRTADTALTAYTDGCSRRAAAPSTTARSAPASDKDFIQPTINTRKRRSRPDHPQTWDGRIGGVSKVSERAAASIAA